MDRVVRSVGSTLRIKNPILRAGLAEFLGTCILIVIGDGSIAQSVLSAGAKGEFISINWAWCTAITFGVFVSINVSGGHINPAVSLAMALIGRLDWIRLVVYILAQYLGAFVGTSIVYLVYYDALETFDGGMRITDPTKNEASAGIFATYPQSFVTTGRGFVDQVVGTAILMIAIMAITDKRNANVPPFLAPFMVGLSALGVGLSYGFNCGYAINPARDLAPRIFTAMAGWGDSVFTFRNCNWFWVPVIGPHIGAVLAAIVYLLFIEFHWPNGDEESEKSAAYRINQEGTANGSFEEEAADSARSDDVQKL